jgi:hypothetical protein
MMQVEARMPEMNSSNVKEDDELVDLGGGGRPMGANESAWKQMGGDADGREREAQCRDKCDLDPWRSTWRRPTKRRNVGMWLWIFSQIYLTIL